MGGCRDEGRFADVVIAARHAQKTEIVHGEEDRIGPEERDPEVESSKRLIEHSSGDFGIPMIYPAKHGHNRRNAHHHVKVRDNEHRVGQRYVHNHVAEKQSGQAAVHERDDEREGKQHRDGEMNVATPQG